jgi:hypothetical protein
MPAVGAREAVNASFPNREALRYLIDCHAAYLVGGTHAYQAHTGIHARTTDLDLFVKEADRDHVLDLLHERGWEAIAQLPHWLTKVRRGDAVIDVIDGSANGVAKVDDLWFRHSLPGHVLGVDVRLVPVEEMIWAKAFTMDKYRFEGADVAHLLLTQAERMNWDRLLWRFGRHWRVLLGHLLFFGYIYPDKRSLVPNLLVDTLLVLLRHEHDDTLATPEDARAAGRPACRGMFLSREQYRVDVDIGGVGEARLELDLADRECELAAWTAVGEREAAPVTEL